MKNSRISTVLALLLGTVAMPALSVDLIVEPLQQAIAVENGKIRAVGNDSQILALKTASTQVIDLDGKVLMPGFVDSHSHVVKGGLALMAANLKHQFLPIDELEQRLRQWRDDGSARIGDTLSVGGTPSDYWAHASELDKRFNQGEWQDVPIFLFGWDYHTGWANRPMLERAGINADYVRSLSGEELATIGQYDDMQPNGFVAESGLAMVRGKLPPATEQQLLQALRTAQSYLHSLGITAWMDPTANTGSSSGAIFDLNALNQTVLFAYKLLSEQGELDAHVAALLRVPDKSKAEVLEDIDKVRKQFLGIPNLTVPGIKVFADGVAEYPAQTAAMLDPYKNSLKYGELLIEPEHFGELVSAADARGWLVHIHAIGDRAVRESLNGIEYARKKYFSTIPHSITHLQMVNPKEFTRFKPLGVIATMQLYWAAADETTIDMVQPYISAMAFRFQYPARSLYKEGAMISGASDWPVTTPDPWKAIYQAISRQGPKGLLAITESLDRETLFQAYTLNAARALLLEDEIGSLAVGKQADFIVLDRDVLTAEPEVLRDTQVLNTFFAGREVFSRK